MYFLNTKDIGYEPLPINPKLKLGRGATANVYQVDHRGQRLAAKIYHEDRSLDRTKISAMISNSPDDCSIIQNGVEYAQLAWPLELIYDREETAVGFLLPFVDQRESFTLDHYYDLGLFAKLRNKDEAALSYKLEIAQNLSKVISSLHKQGHHFVDLKPQNILVFRRNHVVTLLDCDGFSIKHDDARFTASMLSTDYIAPEAQRGLIPPSQLGEDQDRYALAVILFQLLNRGTHPFQGILKDPSLTVNTNDEKAAAGLFPHGLRQHEKIFPRPQSLHRLWDMETRLLFDKAFSSGSEEERPTAAEWEAHFANLLSSKTLVQCDKYPGNLEHMRFRDMPCPECYLKSLEGVDSSNDKSAKRKDRLDKIRNARNSSTQQPYQPQAGGGGGWGWGVAVIAILGFFIWAGSLDQEANYDQSVASVSSNSGPSSNDLRESLNAPTYLRLDFEDGVYIGEVLNGEPNGTGTFRYNGGAVFSGEFKDGLLQGQGTSTFGSGESEGDKYVGAFKDSLRSGQGVYTFANGDVFVGEFRQGQQNGKGNYTYAGGAEISGIWKDGELLEDEARDIIAQDYPDGSRYEGEALDGEFDGQGVLTSAKGDVYDGEWRLGQQHGVGTFESATGDIYVGDWLDGRRTGSGLLVFSSSTDERGISLEGDSYQGEFLDDKFHGYGTYIYGDGEALEGKWVRGEFQAESN